MNGFDNIRSNYLLSKLHWLRVRERIVYKILVTVFKCIAGYAPVDLINMLEVVNSNRSKKLMAKKCNGKIGDRAFSVCGPRL